MRGPRVGVSVRLARAKRFHRTDKCKTRVSGGEGSLEARGTRGEVALAVSTLTDVTVNVPSSLLHAARLHIPHMANWNIW